jgi:hypothetical protein
MVLPCSDRVSRVPPYSRIYKLFTVTGLSPAMAMFPNMFTFLFINHWPTPLSLATTYGISVDFFSSGYLDVSVPQVRFVTLCIHVTIPLMWWVAPFGNRRVKAYSQLADAYRSVSRPSSPPNTKTFTICSYHT